MRRARPTASGLGVVGLSVFIAVVSGCGRGTTPTDSAGGVLASPGATAIDAPSTTAPATTAPPATAPPESAVTVETPLQTPTEETVPDETVPEETVPEETVPVPPSIDTARVVVNQSNVAVDTGGSSSSRSIVDSAAAHLVVQRGTAGLEIASLDVKPGWTEAARTESPAQIMLRYVLGSSSVDIKIWANGAGISSSVVASSDR